MSIKFSPKEAIALIAKSFFMTTAVKEGIPLTIAEFYGGIVEGTIKGSDYQAPEKSIYQELNKTIQNAVDNLLHKPGYEIPSDCVAALIEVFSVENTLHFLKSSDPLAQIKNAISNAFRQSENCDISTLPLERIAEEMLTHVYGSIKNNHNLTGLISMVQILEIKQKIDTLVSLLSSSQCNTTDNQAPLHPCDIKQVLQSMNHPTEDHLDQLTPLPLSKSEMQPIIEKKSAMDYLETNFREYVNAKVKKYQENNIEVGTPQLLLMALNYPGNKALDILNCFDAGGKHSGPYGDKLLTFLNEVDRYYQREHRVYDNAQYLKLQKQIDIWLRNSENTHKLISPITFTYFILKFSNGQTVKMIRSHLGINFNDALGFIRENQLPSFPTSLI